MEIFVKGDIVEDAYGNPSVVLTVDAANQPSSAMMVTGSDRGYRGSRQSKAIGPVLRRVTDEKAVAWARNIAKNSLRHTTTTAL